MTTPRLMSIVQRHLSPLGPADHPALLPCDTVSLHMQQLGIDQRDPDMPAKWKAITPGEVVESLRANYEGPTPAAVILDLEGQFSPARDITMMEPALRAVAACRALWPGVKVGLYLFAVRGESVEGLQRRYARLIVHPQLGALDFIAHSCYVKEPLEPGWPARSVDDVRAVRNLWRDIIEVRPVLSHRINGSPFDPRADDLESGRLLSVDPELTSWGGQVRACDELGLACYTWDGGGDRQDAEGLIESCRVAFPDEDETDPGPPPVEDLEARVRKLESDVSHQIKWSLEAQLELNDLEARIRELESRRPRFGWRRLRRED